MALTVSLPESLKAFIDEEVSNRGYGDSSDYVSDLVRGAAQEREKRQRLKAMLTRGRDSPVAGPADAAYFETLKASIRARGQR